jgi:hypothetical protein
MPAPPVRPGPADAADRIPGYSQNAPPQALDLFDFAGLKKDDSWH